MVNENAKILELIRGCCANQRNSQEELYYLLKPFALKTCYRYSNKMEESEEMMNEAFVKLFKHIHQFDEKRQENLSLSLRGWFKRILVNTCIDHYRKNSSNINGHRLTDESEKLVDHAASGLDMLSYKEIIESIRLLSPAYRTVFNLFVIEGLSHEEISNQLGISVGASKSNLSKARENLRKLLLNKKDYQVYASPER